MAHYNMLANVMYNTSITSWHFRVKILRIHSFRSYVSGCGSNWSYILVDEAVSGTKMEMTVYSEIDHVYQGFNTTNSRFKLSATPDNKLHIIDPLKNQHYMEFKCIHDIPHIKNINYPLGTNANYKNIFQIIYIYNGSGLQHEVHFDDTAGPKMVFYIRDNIESEIKCVATGGHANAFQDGFENMRGRGEVILVLKMWRIRRYFDDDDKWLETKGRLSDFRFNPVCRRLRSSGNHYLTVTLMFGDMGAMRPL
ncbi:hypothetical protein IGI04_023556 [Brassica rapa subsp. trilocularis]|uniref:Uncharacterized protein n=1 Tax=Brassica rapa subsp. trilocularis TaxID=1813537 RepID=A0ABQ7M498_BRACM|nr:hypothetical protein IGI04_023556 [Brassica rapa subsp. trilocularis]